MDKTNQPRGLIRYASYKELHHNGKSVPLYMRPRVIIYSLILLMALGGVIYGFTSLSPTEFKVSHIRQPLFVKLSDGSIQNRYTLKMLNKTKQPISVRYFVAGIEGAKLQEFGEVVEVKPGHVVPMQALVRVPADKINSPTMPMYFEVEVIDNPALNSRYKTVFMGPQ